MPHTARAQGVTRFYVEARLGTLHVRRGGLTCHPLDTNPPTFVHLACFLDVGEGNHFNFGGLFSYRPSVGEDYFWNRFTGRLSLDSFGGEEIQPAFHLRERLYLLNFAVGVDLVQSDRGSITPHVGMALSRDRLGLQGFSPVTGGFVDACSSFQDACDSKWNLLGNYGVAGRFSPIESWTGFFVGADFTRFAGAKNQFVVTTGISF